MYAALRIELIDSMSPLNQQLYLCTIDFKMFFVLFLQLVSHVLLVNDIFH